MKAVSQALQMAHNLNSLIFFFLVPCEPSLREILLLPIVPMYLHPLKHSRPTAHGVGDMCELSDIDRLYESKLEPKHLRVLV